MSGIYKSLQPKDIRYTPYLAHKTVNASFSSDVSSECKVYVAEHSLSSSYNFYQQGYTNIDAGNAYYTSQFATTTDGYYKTAVHAQLDHLFYRNYLSNNKATLGGGAPINLQYRDLGYRAKVISFPTKKVGEGILPSSVQITCSVTYKLEDDGYGNMIFSQGTDAADYDNVMYSNTFNKYYKYVGEGEINDQRDIITYGGYNLITDYYNLSYQTASDATTVEAVFDSARYSRIKLSAPTTELRSIYNMFNRDYAIAFRITPTSTPATDRVILAKQDQMDDYAVDLNGNVFVDQNVPTQYPYKIEFTTANRVRFSKSDTTTTVSQLSSTLALNSAYDFVIQRTGSNFEMWIDGTKYATFTDVFINGGTAGTRFNIREQDCGNECNLYLGNNYNKTLGFDGKLAYFHVFDRALTSTEITNLDTRLGWLNNYCGNVYYNLGLIVLTHPSVSGLGISNVKLKGTVSMTETEVYCTVGPGEFNKTHNRSVWYWNPVHNQFEVDARFQSESFRPYVTTVGLYNDNNELLAVGKLSTPIQTSAKTDTTFVLRYDS